MVLHLLAIFPLWCLIWWIPRVMADFVAFEREQPEPQPVELQQYAIQRRLIGQHSRENRCSRSLKTDLQWGKPLLPGCVQVTLDTNVVAHLHSPQDIFPVRAAYRMHRARAVVKGLPKGVFCWELNEGKWGKLPQLKQLVAWNAGQP